jgi:hypothetical protein
VTLGRDREGNRLTVAGSASTALRCKRMILTETTATTAPSSELTSPTPLPEDSTLSSPKGVAGLAKVIGAAGAAGRSLVFAGKLTQKLAATKKEMTRLSRPFLIYRQVAQQVYDQTRHTLFGIDPPSKGVRTTAAIARSAGNGNGLVTSPHSAHALPKPIFVPISKEHGMTTFVRKERDAGQQMTTQSGVSEIDSISPIVVHVEPKDAVLIQRDSCPSGVCRVVLLLPLGQIVKLVKEERFPRGDMVMRPSSRSSHRCDSVPLSNQLQNRIASQAPRAMPQNSRLLRSLEVAKAAQGRPAQLNPPLVGVTPLRFALVPLVGDGTASILDPECDLGLTEFLEKSNGPELESVSRVGSTASGPNKDFEVYSALGNTFYLCRTGGSTPTGSTIPNSRLQPKSGVWIVPEEDLENSVKMAGKPTRPASAGVGLRKDVAVDLLAQAENCLLKHLNEDMDPIEAFQQQQPAEIQKLRRLKGIVSNWESMAIAAGADETLTVIPMESYARGRLLGAGEDHDGAAKGKYRNQAVFVSLPKGWGGVSSQRSGTGAPGGGPGGSEGSSHYPPGEAVFVLEVPCVASDVLLRFEEVDAAVVS